MNKLNITVLVFLFATMLMSCDKDTDPVEDQGNNLNKNITLVAQEGDYEGSSGVIVNKTKGIVSTSYHSITNFYHINKWEDLENGLIVGLDGLNLDESEQDLDIEVQYGPLANDTTRLYLWVDKQNSTANLEVDCIGLDFGEVNYIDNKLVYKSIDKIYTLKTNNYEYAVEDELTYSKAKTDIKLNEAKKLFPSGNEIKANMLYKSVIAVTHTHHDTNKRLESLHDEYELSIEYTELPEGFTKEQMPTLNNITISEVPNDKRLHNFKSGEINFDLKPVVDLNNARFFEFEKDLPFTEFEHKMDISNNDALDYNFNEHSFEDFKIMGRIFIEGGPINAEVPFFRATVRLKRKF